MVERGGGCLRRAKFFFLAIFQKNPITLNDPQMVKPKNKPPVLTGLSLDSYANYAPPKKNPIKRLQLFKEIAGPVYVWMILKGGVRGE